MATSPASSARRSRTPPLVPSASSHPPTLQDETQPPDIPVDTLVNHLLVAKRSLSSMTLVLRANQLSTMARATHEQALILSAQTGFLHHSILDQVAILSRLERTFGTTCDWAARDFKSLLKTMDDVDAELTATMEMLRGTLVQPDLQPDQSGTKNLLDFVDESGVQSLRDALKKSIQNLQNLQLSFNQDRAQFESDIDHLQASIPDPSLASETSSASEVPMGELVDGLDEHSSTMAQLLASLTKHFDMCVTAIRTTEGAAALARRKAAEVTQSQGSDDEPVSISGVIAAQESHMSDLEPKTARDRAEMLRIVAQDALEVDDVVREMQERLASMEQLSAALQDKLDRTTKAHRAVLAAAGRLSDLDARLAGHVAAEDDFHQGWDREKSTVFGKLDEMKGICRFYEGYASAYGSLVLEVERRRLVDRQVEACWRKARHSVDGLLAADGLARAAFCRDVGHYLPTDLWSGIQRPPRTWILVPPHEPEPVAPDAGHEKDGAGDEDDDDDEHADDDDSGHGHGRGRSVANPGGASVDIDTDTAAADQTPPHGPPRGSPG